MWHSIVMLLLLELELELKFELKSKLELLPLLVVTHMQTWYIYFFKLLKNNTVGQIALGQQNMIAGKNLTGKNLNKSVTW